MATRRRGAWGAGCGLAGLLLMGCGPDRGPTDWIPEDAAAVQCTTAGPLRMPPALLGVPGPSAPSGFYGRKLDPISLSELGYAREKVVCAVLESPRAEEVMAAQVGVQALLSVHEATTRAAQEVGHRCTCDTARALGVRTLIPSCVGAAPMPLCNPQDRVEAMREAVRPLLERIEETPIPLVHWRLVGKTDRSGWLIENVSELFGRHPGGSELFVPGKGVPRRGNHVLIERLLEEDGVVGVIRQDAGRAVLVVRELGRRLVLDHFSHVTADEEHAPLLTALDNARAQDYVDRLQQPEETRRLGLPASEGNLVELDRAALMRVDAMVDAATPLGGETRRAASVQGPLLVDRVTMQAPFGREGRWLRAKLILSEQGVEWAQSLGDELISPTLDELNLPERAEVPTRAEDGLPYVYRRTPTETYAFGAVERTPQVLQQVEMQHPGTVRGRASKWRVEMPMVDLAAMFLAEAPFEGVRALMRSEAYGVDVEFDNQRRSLRVEVRPR